MSNFFIDVWTGDIVALTGLFFLFLPFVLVYAGVRWLIDKVRGK